MTFAFQHLDSSSYVAYGLAFLKSYELAVHVCESTDTEWKRLSHMLTNRELGDVFLKRKGFCMCMRPSMRSSPVSECHQVGGLLKIRDG